MVYRKKTYKPAKGGYLRKAGSAINIAQKAYRMAVGIASIINSEKKHYDGGHSGTITNAWTVAPLSEFAVGDTDITRDGNSVALKTLQVDQKIAWNSAGDADQLLRVMLIRCNDNMDGTQPDMTEVLDSSQYQILAHRNMDFGSKFTVLHDKVFSRDSTKQALIPATYFKKFFNKKDYKGDKTVATHLKWMGASATDTTTGHIYVCAISNKSTNAPGLDTLSRIRFYDN